MQEENRLLIGQYERMYRLRRWICQVYCLGGDDDDDDNGARLVAEGRHFSEGGTVAGTSCRAVIVAAE